AAGIVSATPSGKGTERRTGTVARPAESDANPTATASIASFIGQTKARSAARRRRTVISLTSLGGARRLTRHGPVGPNDGEAGLRRTQMAREDLCRSAGFPWLPS